MLRKDEIFAGQIGAPSTDFAYGAPVNESADGAEDGTPWSRETVLDEWAFFEALLLKGSITPDGLPDTRNRSQLFDAMHAVMRGLVAKGHQAQEGATDSTYLFRVPFATPPVNTEWELRQDNSQIVSRLYYRQTAIDPTKKLALVVPQMLPRFAINGVAVTVRNTYAGADQKMTLKLGRYSRELTSHSVIHNAVLNDGDAVLYPFATPPGASEPGSHVMFRSYIYVIEITPQSEPHPSNGSFPSIYSIDIVGKYNPIPAGV